MLLQEEKNNVSNKKEKNKTMTKDENVKKPLEAVALTKHHSEDEVRRISYLLKRFFAKYNFPFAGNCIKPAQNDGKILVPQSLSNLVPFCSLAPCGRGQGEGLNPCKKKAAFTLAEVLITLGIIGVVAAMTIPNLIAEQQKRTTVTKLQRAMSVLNQAYRRAYDDVGEATAEEAASMGSKEYFNKYWAPYLKILHICKSYKDCGYDSPQPYTAANGQKSTLTFFIDGFRVPVQTADGFIYTINIKAGNESTRVPTIVVDINGGAKPNKYGKDIFFFIREIDGEKGGVVRPYGYNETSFFDIDSSCTKSGVGEFCAEKIRRAGWQIDKSYPW